MRWNLFDSEAAIEYVCLPPLTWQTYDVDFTAAKFDVSGKRLAWPRITVRLNGVVIHRECRVEQRLHDIRPLFEFSRWTARTNLSSGAQ